MVFGTVKSRDKDFDGQSIGKADRNAILYTIVYNVEFSNGENAELGVNFVEECIYLNVTMKATSTGLWIILLAIGRIAILFAKITKRLQ